MLYRPRSQRLTGGGPMEVAAGRAGGRGQGGGGVPTEGTEHRVGQGVWWWRRKFRLVLMVVSRKVTTGE